MKMYVKRSLFLFLGRVLMLVSVSLLSKQAVAANALVGDVNGNNAVNVCDVARLYAHSVKRYDR